MANPPMQTMLCTIHNLHFAFERDGGAKESTHVPCPRCAAQDLGKAMRDLARATQQRDALLEAIDIKRLIRPVTP